MKFIITLTTYCNVHTAENCGLYVYMQESFLMSLLIHAIDILCSINCVELIVAIQIVKRVRDIGENGGTYVPSSREGTNSTSE